MALVPKREREQAPELATAILAAGDVVVEEPRDHFRVEVALTLKRLAREGLSGERLELTAEPGGCGDREAALLAVDDLSWQQRGGRLAQQDLLGEAADLESCRKREREIRHDRVEIGHAGFERVRHRGAVSLDEQVVDEVHAEVDVLQAGELIGALGLEVPVAKNVDGIERRPASGEL